MQTSLFNAPALYGDHHVSDVRKQLLALPGVQDVYASSAFCVVEVTYDEALVSEDILSRELEQLGYLSEIPMMAETGIPAQRSQEDGFFRQTATYGHLKKVVSFQQRVQHNGDVVWNCPGLGVMQPDCLSIETQDRIDISTAQPAGGQD